MANSDPKRSINTYPVPHQMRTRLIGNVLLVWTSAMLFGCVFERPVAIIPVEIVNGNPVTTVKIGDELIEVVVDTGGFGGIAISPEDLQRLSVRFTGESVERIDSSGNQFESREFVVPELLLGGHRFTKILGFERVSASSGLAGGAPMNVLGRAVLHDFTVVVDYPNREIRLYSPDQARRICGAATFELIEMQNDLLALPISTDGGQMLAVMDTGATYSFVQSKVVAARELRTVDDSYRTNTLRIGDRDLGPLEMVALPIEGAPEIDALIGANFFSDHKVCFDYSGRRLSFLD